jgi:rRNA-processing protein FCF1
MILPPEELCKGLRVILYGRGRPSALIDEYDTGGKEMIRSLFDIPEQPREYVSASAVLMQHWSGPESEDLSSWPDLFYIPAQPREEPFHPLCRIYDHLVYGEIRMILFHTLRWREEAEITLFTYHLVTLTRYLIEYLKEAAAQNDASGKTKSGLLEQYLKRRICGALLSLITDLNHRFESVLGERKVQGDELYLIHLEKAQPQEPEVVLTPAGTAFLLDEISRKRDSIKSVERLLGDARKRWIEADGETEAMHQKSVEILENGWLRMWLMIHNRRDRCPEAGDMEANRQYLMNFVKDLKKSRLPKQKKEKLLAFAAAEKTVFHGNVPETESAAAQLYRALEKERKALESSVLRTKEQALKKGEDNVKASGLLEEYVFVYELQEALKVTDQTLDKYLRNASVPILKFSQKTRLIRKDDFQKMIEHYNEKP